MAIKQIVRAGELYFVAYYDPVTRGAGHLLLEVHKDFLVKDFFAEAVEKIRNFSANAAIQAFNRIGSDDTGEAGD